MLVWGYGACLWVMLAYALALMPAAFGDQFGEAALTFRATLWEYLHSYLSEIRIFFRPFEHLWREIAMALFGERLFAFNLLGITLVGLIAALCLALFPVRSPRQALAATIALSALLGHHAFAASMELNQVISNLVIVALLLIGLHLLDGRGGPGAALAAVVVSALALPTKEIGLIVPTVLVLAWLIGFRGVRAPAALAIAGLTGAYLAYRVYVVLGLGMIEDTTRGDQGGPETFPLKVVAALLNIVLSEPKGTDFLAIFDERARSLLRPWKLAQIMAPLASFGVIAYVAVTRRAWRAEAEPDLRRWLILLAAALVGSALLGFYHSADYFGVTCLPLLAVALYRSINLLMADLDDARIARGRRICLAVLLVALSAAWTCKLPSNAFFLRGLSATIQDDWAGRFEAHEARITDKPDLRYLAVFREHALGTPVAEAVAGERWLRGLFGRTESIAR